MTEPTPLDRLLNSLRALIRAELAEVPFLGAYEYAVVTSDGTASSPASTVDAEPLDKTLNLPDLAKVPIRLPYGVTPPVGALCTIQFLNGNPAKPMVVNFNDPMTLMVFAGGKLPNARQGDMVAVTLGGPSAAATAVMTAFAAQFVSPTGPCVWTPAGPPTIAYGLITSGRPQVKS
ncbi:MAG TPA: hypothetical protein VH062_07625 [Polyangiaceae bacterium]|nr:hypothetical protein [Polyangiaceae bacterium]